MYTEVVSEINVGTAFVQVHDGDQQNEDEKLRLPFLLIVTEETTFFCPLDRSSDVHIKLGLVCHADQETALEKILPSTKVINAAEKMLEVFNNGQQKYLEKHGKTWKPWKYIDLAAACAANDIVGFNPGHKNQTWEQKLQKAQAIWSLFQLEEPKLNNKFHVKRGWNKEIH